MSKLYGSFFLGHTEFAIDAALLQEVVTLPEPLTHIPMAPPHVSGLFNMRGVMIPVLDLRKMIPFDFGSSSEEKKVVVVECQGVRVGMVFDSTGEIFAAKPDQKSEFRSANPNDPSVVSSVLRLENGKRILQILEPSELIRIHNLSHVLENQKKFQLERKDRRGLRRKCISFNVGGSLLAFDINGIDAIERVPEMKVSTLNLDLCLGSVVIRGHDFPLINFAGMIGQTLRASAKQDDRRVIVFKGDAGVFGILVDGVDSIISYYADEVMPIPLLSSDRSELFLGIMELPQSGQELVLLDHNKFKADKDISALTQAHARMNHSPMLAKAAAQKPTKEVYLSFRIDQLFAIPLSEVQEIIAYPKEVNFATGLPPYVRGVMNLRGNMVTIVDTRALYGLPPAQPVEPRILIFNAGKDKYGMVVDEVENILSVFSDQWTTVPDLFYGPLQKKIGSDIRQVIEVMPPNGQKYCMIILDPKPVANKIPRTA